MADGAALEMLCTLKVPWVQIPPSPPFFRVVVFPVSVRAGLNPESVCCVRGAFSFPVSSG